MADSTGLVLAKPGKLGAHAIDTGRGVDTVSIALDGAATTRHFNDSNSAPVLTVPDAGIHTIVVQATDLADNVAEATLAFGVVDTTPSPSPSESPTPIPTQRPRQSKELELELTRIHRPIRASQAVMLVAVTDFVNADDGAAILANAKALEPLLRAGAEDAERSRRLTPDLVKALRQAGVFRMSMPAAWGGPEVDILTQVEVIEVLSRSYASAGWCAMIGSDGGFYAASLSDRAARKLYPSLDAITAGYVFPAGRLDVVDGGFRLSGRWPFGSGCTHADVIAGGALVFDGGQPRTRSDGTPERRLALLPASCYQILDTWSTTGLAGSGSHDYTTTDAFVPREQTFVLGEDVKRAEPLYTWPGLLVANAPGVPLGIARDALDVARAVLTDKLMTPDRTRARDEAPVRIALARAEALVGSARSYQFDVLGSFWASLEAGRQPDLRQRAALGGSYVHTFRTCVEAVQLLYETVGSAAIYSTCPLDRHLRDVITIGQHIVGQVRMLEQVGGMWFGVEPQNPIL